MHPSYISLPLALLALRGKSTLLSSRKLTSRCDDVQHRKDVQEWLQICFTGNEIIAFPVPVVKTSSGALKDPADCRSRQRKRRKAREEMAAVRGHVIPVTTVQETKLPSQGIMNLFQSRDFTLARWQGHQLGAARRDGPSPRWTKP